MLPIRSRLNYYLSKVTFSSSKFSQVKDKAENTIHHDIFKPKVLFILGGPGAGKGKLCLLF